MSFFAIVLTFLTFRSLDFLLVYFSSLFIPYLGFFPYIENLTRLDLPKLIYSFANFDGVHYLLIAKNGYTTYQQAFFPLYPLLIRWLSFSSDFLPNLLLTGLLISNLSFLLGLWIFSKYLLEIKNLKLGIWPIIFLLAYPTSFFFGALYTEGLFFLFMVSVLYFLRKEKYLLVFLFAFLAALTKFIGFFLLIPILLSRFSKFSSLHQSLNFKNLKNFLLSEKKYLLALLSPIFGLGIYCLYLWQTHGDPFFFMNSQWAFGAHRSSKIILLPQVLYRYLNIFLTADFNFQYFISLLEFLIFNFVFGVLIFDLQKNLKTTVKNYYLLGLNFFSLINILLPTLTGTLSSIPRYSLFSLSFFICLAGLKNSTAKIIVITIFAILHILILGFFIQGYFVS